MDITQLTNDQRASLRERAGEVCVVYSDHPLPAGVVPRRGRIGVELGPEGQARLFLARGHRYDGGARSIRALVERGEQQFASLDELLAWFAFAQLPADTRVDDVGVHDVPHDTVQLVPGADADVTETDASDGRPDHGALVVALRAAVGAEVVGQERAVAAVCDAVATHVLKIEPRSPLTVLLTGPTGVGKTLLALAVADALASEADESWTTFRVDMSEFEQHHRVASLLGAPPGYTGSAARPAFLEHLSEHPRTVVVLDEIEKAHPDVMMSFMAAFDAGRLTPSSGASSLDVRRCVFVCTSNLAVDELDRYRADNPDAEAVEATRALMMSAGMRPEVVNRFDAVVAFDHLTDAAIAALVVREIRRSGREFGLDIRRIEAAVSARVVDALPALERFGGRSAARAVADVLGGVLAGATPRGPVDLVELMDAVDGGPVPALVQADPR